MSIIPWMVAASTNGNAACADTFATYTATGIRGLSITAGVEYASSITAGANSNVSTASVAVPNIDTGATVNSLHYTTASATNIGTGKTLTISSGGLIFTIGGTIGASGNTAAGTLQFGLGNVPTEAVIWSNGNNQNTIGASISGSGGLSKAGSSTLALTGMNTYSGLTYVGGGTLQVGDGINTSNLGLTGDVAVANGATFSLPNDGAIADTDTLRLEQFGLANGKLNLGLGVNETIGSLYIGDLFAVAGTYGSSLSSATFQNDTFFSGPDIVTVVPEPASAAFAFGGLDGCRCPNTRSSLLHFSSVPEANPREKNQTYSCAHTFNPVANHAGRAQSRTAARGKTQITCAELCRHSH
ncbi:autotransporter-associated beta strand repeat-containing protein [Verrucomicrobiota bacterium sgz303538]